MAKIKHNHFMDTIDDVIGHAKAAGVVHLYAEGTHLSGRHVTIGGKTLYHFGTTGYLGLEQDARLKQAAIEAIQNYGTQFPLSKTYISHPLYAELEEALTHMYQHPIIVTKNSTLGHMAVIPCAVRDEDAIIIDHQVHWSVQQATQLLKLRGVPVEMIRHNHMGMLEDRIKKLKDRHKNIWYMADGVYSMFGDAAPIADLKALCQLYPQLHLYYDDVHGMSWKGPRGTGFIMDAYDDLPDNVLLFGTLSKTFGASGAVLVSPNKVLHRRIKNFGGPLTFSAQLEPSAVAAALASANIHLSSEIYDLQDDLMGKIKYFNHLLAATDLPLIVINETPVFYIGTGLPDTGYRFVKRLMDAGFFVNLGLYPAVPVKNTGVRITISRHNKKADIQALVAAMVYHYPKALAETGATSLQVLHLFKKSISKKGYTPEPTKLGLTLFYETTIDAIEKTDWNQNMAYNCFDWEGLRFLERVFKHGDDYLHRWQFHYYVVRDSEGVPVVMTFFTSAIMKDDMLAPEAVSRKVELLRKTSSRYLTSRVMGMGSLFTEGRHCYINREQNHWQDALTMLLESVENLTKSEQIGTTMLRDFPAQDADLKHFFYNKGFIKMDLPDSSKIADVVWADSDHYVASLSKRSRRHFKKDIAPYTSHFEIEFESCLSPQDLLRAYDLYKHVKDRNYGLNTFTYPLELFEHMNQDPLWEFIILHLKVDTTLKESPIVGVMFCYKNTVHQIYVPSLIGMDYAFLERHQVYRQLLYQTILRAISLRYQSIDFGITAAFEKRKVGATTTKIVAYVQADDNYTMEFIQGL